MKSKVSNTKPHLRFELETAKADDLDAFEIEFVNFPKNRKYILSSRRPLLDEVNYANLQQIKLDGENFYTILDLRSLHESRQEKFTQLLCGFAPGERVEYRIATPRKNVITESSFVPRPIKKESKKGTFKVSAELVSCHPTSYAIRLEGIGKKETIQMTSRSGLDFLEKEIADAGSTPITFSPISKEETGGIAQLAFVRDSGDLATLTLNFGDKIAQGIKEEQDLYWGTHELPLHVVKGK